MPKPKDNPIEKIEVGTTSGKIREYVSVTDVPKEEGILNIRALYPIRTRITFCTTNGVQHTGMIEYVATFTEGNRKIARYCVGTDSPVVLKSGRLSDRVIVHPLYAEKINGTC